MASLTPRRKRTRTRERNLQRAQKFVGGRPPFGAVSARLDSIIDWSIVIRSARYKCENIAAAYFVSDRHLERFFLSRFGESPKRWVQSIRMQLAGDLVRCGYSTKAVAAELCYQGPSQFCREFKRHFGRSPQHFASSPTSRLSPTMSESANQLELSEFNPRFKIPRDERLQLKPYPKYLSNPQPP